MFVSAGGICEAIRGRESKQTLGNKPLRPIFSSRAAWPLPVPQHEISGHGQFHAGIFSARGMAAYADQFPDRKFNNYCGEMAGKILPLADYNGYDRIIAGMKDGPGVAWYFPNPMQGFPVDAQREAGKFLRYCIQHNLPYKLSQRSRLNRRWRWSDSPEKWRGISILPAMIAPPFLGSPPPTRSTSRPTTAGSAWTRTALSASADGDDSGGLVLLG